MTSTDDQPPDPDPAVAEFSVPEMDCPSCVGKVENALGGVDGISDADLRPTTGSVSVAYDAEHTTDAEIAGAIEGAGYAVADSAGESATATDDGPAADARDATPAAGD